MTPKYYQTLENGQRCSAPAIAGSKYCRHHDQQRAPKQAKEESSEFEPLMLPPLVDKPSMLFALNEVVQALSSGRIKRSVAHTLLSAIKLANRLLTEIEEAGLSVILPTRQIRPAMAIAASIDRQQPAAPFNPALRYPPSASTAYSNVDPDTARIVRELVAQSRNFPRTDHQQPTAKS